MKISELVSDLQQIEREHGDLFVSGAYIPGHPEMTIHGVHHVGAGPLQTASPDQQEGKPPERVVIEWKVA